MTCLSQPLANANLPRPNLSAIGTPLLSPLTLPLPSLLKDVVHHLHLLNRPCGRLSVPSFHPQRPEVRDTPFRLFHSMGPNCTLAGMQLVPDQLPLSSPPNLQAFSYASTHALSTSDFSSSTSAIHPYTEPIYHHPYANDSWEVIHESRIFKPIIPGTYKRPKTPKSSKTTNPSKSPKLPLPPITPPTQRMPILHAGSTPHLSIPTPTATATPPVITKGYDSEGLAPRLRDLRQRISKGAQLHIRTGSLSSLATLGSTLSSPVKQPHNLTLINVNMVVMGPQRSGVSSLIYRFINGTNGWVAPATVDDFWHHVVRSKSEERITYYNITEVTGEEEYEGLRKSMLRRAQVVVLCFRLDRKVQFKRDCKRVWPCYSSNHDWLLTWAVRSCFLTSPPLARSQSSLSEHTTTRHREQCRMTRHATCYIAPVPLSDIYTTGLDVCSLDPSHILRDQRAPRSWCERDLHRRSTHPTCK